MQAEASALEALERTDTYREWQRQEGVAVIEDFLFENLEEVELSPWPRKGGRGVIINIPNPYLKNDAHLVEIAPGGVSEPEHHLYEELVYVVAGRGSTSVWLDENRKQTFEWGEGSVFTVPLNAWYQNFNGSGTQPARYLAVTNAPPVLRQFQNLDFVLNNPYQFADRFAGEDGFFSGEGKLYRGRRWRANFIPDTSQQLLYGWRERGAGGVNVHLELPMTSLAAHISEFPVGTYKKAHRHGPGAHLVILSGEGFSLMWQAGEEPRQCNWRKGGMVIVPMDNCFHQHFNAGTTPARYLALRGGESRVPDARPMSDVSIKDGGWQVEYEDENPRIHEIFESELARHGAPCLMKSFIPWCTGSSVSQVASPV